MQCTAVVTITLQVALRQPWQPTATVEEVHRAAAREAVEKIEKLAPHYPMIGQPIVEIVTTTKVSRD